MLYLLTVEMVNGATVVKVLCSVMVILSIVIFIIKQKRISLLSKLIVGQTIVDGYLQERPQEQVYQPIEKIQDIVNMSVLNSNFHKPLEDSGLFLFLV